MRLIIMLLFALSLLSFAQDTTRLCVVTLRAIDVGGSPLPHRVESFKNGSGIDFAKQFEGLRGRVPCEIFVYTFSIVRSDVSALVERYTRIEGKVSAWDPENWLTVSTNPNLVIVRDRAGEVSWALPAGYVWNGRVAPVSGEQLWIHMRSVVRSEYAEAEMETEVDANGDFRIYGGFLKGPYTLYVFNRKGQILYAGLFKLEGRAPREPLVISLPPVPPALFVVH